MRGEERGEEGAGQEQGRVRHRKATAAPRSAGLQGKRPPAAALTRPEQQPRKALRPESRARLHHSPECTSQGEDGKEAPHAPMRGGLWPLDSGAMRV